jgi:hypothetical protein
MRKKIRAECIPEFGQRIEALTVRIDNYISHFAEKCGLVLRGLYWPRQRPILVKIFFQIHPDLIKKGCAVVLRAHSSRIKRGTAVRYAPRSQAIIFGCKPLPSVQTIILSCKPNQIGDCSHNPRGLKPRGGHRDSSIGL